MDAGTVGTVTTYASVNPATGETLEEFPTLDEQGVETALARVRSGFDQWRTASLAARPDVPPGGCARPARSDNFTRPRKGPYLRRIRLGV